MACNQRFFKEQFNKDQQLVKLMRADSIQTAFQPILSLQECETLGFEVLNRPDCTPLFPSTEKFYDYVGKSGKVFLVEGFLRNISLQRYAEQLEQEYSFREGLIFVNIQPQVLADPSYRSGTTLDLLAKYGLSPEQIVLELTEKEAVTDYVQFEKVIANYRQQGFRIAVDDAGTGYNSLKTILSLKPEFIKLDKSIVRDIQDQTAQQHLVEILLEFAAHSKTNVIAEGIESFSEMKFLKEMGVQFGQGYALGRPEAYLDRGVLPTG